MRPSTFFNAELCPTIAVKAVPSPSAFTSMHVLSFAAKPDLSRGSENAKTFEFIAMSP
jgi:hypothetical protein